MMHIPDAMEKTVKLPVVIEDGQVRYCYGKMPTLKDNTTGYLVVPAHALAESAIAEKLQQEIVVPLLLLATWFFSGCVTVPYHRHCTQRASR